MILFVAPQAGWLLKCGMEFFAEKVAYVVGWYLALPNGAVALSIDEKTQM